MIEMLKRPAVALIASGVLLTGILAGMVYDRVRLLKTGREIVLQIRPVDPRDLFKGDYVRLAYDISQAKPELLKTLEPNGRQNSRQRPVFVTLEQTTADQPWQIVTVAEARPAKLAANQIVLAGKLTYRGLTYGLERYYVQEGHGLTLEEKALKQQLSALVAVDAKGRAAIKGLIMDGKKIYDEPLL